MTASMAAITSVVVFTDDATELSFSDGSQVALSPCGAAFTCPQPATRGQHPLAGSQGRVWQRTEFATSEFRQRVGQALECRNRFADSPYLSGQYLPDDAVLVSISDSSLEINWTIT